MTSFTPVIYSNYCFSLYQTYHPTVPMLRSASLTHNLHHMVPSTGFPYSISGTISTFDHTCVTTSTTAASAAACSTAETPDRGPYGPVYTLPPPPGSLHPAREAQGPVPRRIATLGSATPLQPRLLSRFRRSARTTWTSHGPPDYDTVMAGTANPAFIFEHGEPELDLPRRTPPPSYESVLASMGEPSGGRQVH